MGFEEDKVLEALRITDNNQENACEWLLGDHSRDHTLDALEDGIDPSSPIYQSIITNPIVQLGLSNPRCLLGNNTHIYKHILLQFWLITVHQKHGPWTAR